MTDPTAAEVLAWMSRTGRTPADAVDQFWPGVGDDERARVRAKVRQWASRARRSGQPGAPPPVSAPVRGANRDDDEPTDERRPLVEVEDRHYDAARMARIPFLERQLARQEAVIEAVLREGLVGRFAPLDARLSEVRHQLDQERREAGTQVTLDRSPAAVADEVERRAKRIRELASRARDRDL